MKLSWDLEKKVEELTLELNTYRFESGSGRGRIRREVARDCADVARRNGAPATADAIARRYNLAAGFRPKKSANE